MEQVRIGRLAAYGVFLGASVSMSSMAMAQTVPTIAAPPIRSPVDENGINLATGTPIAVSTDVSIGAADAGGLAHARSWSTNGWRHDFFLTITTTSTSATVSIGRKSDTFTLSGGVYTSDQGAGATLTATASTYTYTSSDGTVVTFDRTIALPGSTYNGPVSGVGTSITRPTGGCCQSNANRSPHDAVWSLRADVRRRATATRPVRLSGVP